MCQRQFVLREIVGHHCPHGEEQRSKCFVEFGLYFPRILEEALRLQVDVFEFRECDGAIPCAGEQ